MSVGNTIGGCGMEWFHEQQQDRLRREADDFVDAVSESVVSTCAGHTVHVELGAPIVAQARQWSRLSVTAEWVKDQGEEYMHYSGRGFARRLTRAGVPDKRDPGYWQNLPYGTADVLAQRYIPADILDRLKGQ